MVAKVALDTPARERNAEAVRYKKPCAESAHASRRSPCRRPGRLGPSIGPENEGTQMAEPTVDTAGVNAPASAPPARPPVAAYMAGNPAVFGLLIFSVGGTNLGISLFGYVSATAQGGSVMPIIFVATVFGAFAGFWISYSALVLGLTHNWYGIPPADIAHTVAQFLIAWAVVVLVLAIVSLRIPLAFTLILGSALVAVIFLIIGDLNASSAGSMDKVAGVFVLLFSAVGFYAFLSTGLESVGGNALPLGRPVIVAK